MDCSSQSKVEVTAHASHSLSCTLYALSSKMTSSCLTSQNIMTPPCLPVNSISSVTQMQRWLYSINKNTRCAVYHDVLWALGHRSQCVFKPRPWGVHVHISQVLQLPGSVAQLQLGQMTFCTCSKSLLLLLVTLRDIKALAHWFHFDFQDVILLSLFQLHPMCSYPPHFCVSNLSI